MGDTTSLVPGFPIRTSSDQRSVGNSPRHIAASNVLHRLPVPRHPPCALKHLQHKNQKMSFNKNCTSTHNNMTTTRRPQPHPCVLDARNHYPQIKHHTPPPKRGNNTPTPTNAGATPTRGHGPVVSKPNSVSGSPSTQCFPHRISRLLCTKPRSLQPDRFLTATPPPIGSVFRGAP